MSHRSNHSVSKSTTGRTANDSALEHSETTTGSIAAHSPRIFGMHVLGLLLDS